MKLIKNLFAGIFGLLIALAFVELGIRILGRLQSNKPQWIDRPKFYFAPENTTTLQDYNYPRKKPQNTFRIAVVGDSYTFAPYMQFSDAWPKKLEVMLNLNDTDSKVEVLNFAVPAYSSSHEIALVEKSVKYKADLVLLQITLNDPELKPYRPTGIREDLPDRFGAFIPQGRLAQLFSYWKTGAFVAERLHNSSTHQAYIDYFIDLFKHKRGYQIFKDSILKMAGLCAKHNIPMYGFVFPLFGLPLDENYPFHEIHEMSIAALTEAHVPAFDLYETYKNIPFERLQVYPGVDRHPNEIAHRIAAEEIYITLANNNALPKEALIKNLYTKRMGTANQPHTEIENLKNPL